MLIAPLIGLFVGPVLHHTIEADALSGQARAPSGGSFCAAYADDPTVLPQTLSATCLAQAPLMYLQERFGDRIALSVLPPMAALCFSQLSAVTYAIATLAEVHIHNEVRVDADGR